jgi:fatty-acid desaturase
MKIKNDWVRASLAIAMYFSCLVIALSLFQIPIELRSNGSIPLRIIVMLAVAIIIWCLVAYFSEEAAWKTVAKLICYVLALSSIGIAGFGFHQLISHFFSEPAKISMLRSVVVTILGVITVLGIGKGIKSKWLN